MFKLRPYQEEGVQDCISYLEDKKDFKKAVVIDPTGAGKSLIIAKVAEYITTPVVVIQPSKELLLQNFEKYKNFGGEATVFSASLGQKDISHTTFATIGSVISHISLFKALGVSTVLIDEAHYNCATGSMVDRFIKGLGKNIKVIGFTATPIILHSGMYGAELKMINRTHKSIFNKIIHVTQIKDIKDKYWSPLVYNIYEQKSKGILTKNSNGSDFTDDSLNKYYFENKLADSMLSVFNEVKDKEKSILIFAPSIAAGKDLQSKIKGSHIVTSKTDKKERDYIISNFKSGNIQTVINVNILGIGFDMPSLACIFELRPTMSIAIYYQHIGRAVRPFENKTSTIYDFSGNYERFGKVEDLMFENLDGYGWGMFNGEQLLTNIPIGYKTYKKDIVKEVIKIDTNIDSNVSFHFGKHNGVSVSDVAKKDGGYLTWLISNKDFTWVGEKNIALKKEIEKILSAYTTR